MRHRRLCAALALTIVLAACSGDGAPDTRAGDEAPASGAPGDKWLAVLEVAEDPNKLDALSQKLARRLPAALVVSPAGCFGGLPRELGLRPSGYVIGLLADSEEELTPLVERSGREPLVQTPVKDRCPV